MMEEKKLHILIAGLLLVVAILSVWPLGNLAVNPKSYSHTISVLDEKEQNVLQLTAGATATSVLITLIPDDIATPLADKLADVAGYLVIVICAVYAEKYILTLAGFAAFRVLIPAACLLLIWCLFQNRQWKKQLAIKLVILGMAAVTLIPVSISASEMIEGIYSESISTTIEEAQQSQDQVGSQEAILEKAKSIINNYVQAVAIFIVTSCVIPVFILILFGWVLKMLFGININVRPPESHRRKRKHGQDIVPAGRES